MNAVRIDYITEYGGKGELIIDEWAYTQSPKVQKMINKILHPSKKKVQIIVNSIIKVEIND